MSGHGAFIVVLTVLNIAGALWLLWWTRRSPADASGKVETTGHVWDDDLTELNSPLPRWWLWLFILTVAFAGVYLVLYPGLGDWCGTLNWTSHAEHDAAARANARRIEQTLAPFAQRDVRDLEHDTKALAIGRNLFLNNCAACHGSDAGGAPGFPNLTDNDWLWGGSPERVVETISNGRTGVMPPWGEALGEQGVDNVVAYLFSLQGKQLSAGNAAAGKATFEQICSACHGPEGRGNPDMGTPNLTDHIWLHGGSVATVRETIDKGTMGTMPPHLARLGETRVHLLAAYVLSLGDSQSHDRVAGTTDGHGNTR